MTAGAVPYLGRYPSICLGDDVSARMPVSLSYRDWRTRYSKDSSPSDWQ